MRLVKAKSTGFTIVELLVVIVVIGVLAGITIVGYTGINQRAIVASLQTDLSTSSQQLKMYNTEYGSYPQTFTGNCPTAPVSDSRYCLKSSQGNTLIYCPVPPYTAFSIKDTNTNGTTYMTSDNSSPAAAATVFSTGGTITNPGCTRTHTFDTSCTSGSPCVITAAASGTISVSIIGGGGGGGSGDDTDGYAGNPGNPGGNSTLTYAGTTYVANGGGGGQAGGAGGGCPGSIGSTGGVTAFALTGAPGGGALGGIPGTPVAGCYGGAGGNGGKVSGDITVSSGSTVTIVVGSGGSGGVNLGGGGTGGDGNPGQVIISYPG